MENLLHPSKNKCLQQLQASPVDIQDFQEHIPHLVHTQWQLDLAVMNLKNIKPGKLQSSETFLTSIIQASRFSHTTDLLHSYEPYNLFEKQALW